MLGIVYNYFETAISNEEIFRGVLRDLKKHRHERPNGDYIPKNLETEIALKEIFKKYSYGIRIGIFTISNFQIDTKKRTAIIEFFQDTSPLAGGGAELKYEYNEKKVTYVKCIYMSCS